jgi:hypothetical protein
MDDEIGLEALVRGVETLTLPNGRFRHRDHLRFAHHRLVRDGYPFALDTVGAAIARFASHHGHGEKFNLTLTQCWVRLVAGALAEASAGLAFDETIARNPELLDTSLPLRYYSRDRLFSGAARRSWLEPDLRELPRCPIHRGVAA